MKKVVMVLSVLVFVVVAGCGGLTTTPTPREDPPPPLVHGVANIPATAERPMVAVVKLNGNKWENAAEGSPVSPVNNGFADVSFGVVAPAIPTSGDSVKFMLAAYDDKDGDGKYRLEEYLGVSNCYLQWKGSARKWQILNPDGSVRWDDAYVRSGRENVYIEEKYPGESRSKRTGQLMP